MAPSKERRFTFIPVDCRSKSAQEAIRGHIMRHRHYQARLNRKVKKARPASQAQFEEQLHFWESSKGQISSPEDPTTPHAPISSSGSHSPQPFGTIYESSPPRPAEEEFALGGTTVDQASSPVDQDYVEQTLIQYYQQYGGGSKITDKLLRFYRETTGTFSAFLAMMAMNYSDEQGQPPLLDVAELENRALQEVSAQISHSPTAPACSTMVAVAVLANLRECRQEHDLVDCHWSAIRQMIEINGGINRLRMHPDLYDFLIWAEVVVFRTTAASIAQLTGASIPVVTIEQELRDFFGILSLHLASITHSEDIVRSKLTLPIQTVLRRPPCRKSSYSAGKWRRGKFACLLFFAALDQQSTFLLQDDPCYRTIEGEVLDRGRQYILYPEELYMVITRVTNQDSLCQLTWEVTRIMCAIKHLAQRDTNTCYRLLATYLGFSDPFESNMLFDEWDELSSRLEATA